MLAARDHQLVQLVDAATADAARRSGSWLKCALGCTECCHGVFAISQLDALRLRDGLRKLEDGDPARAAALLARVKSSVQKLSAEFPGDISTGILDPDAEDRWQDFANDEPCPVLNPETGACDLYAARPLTCRVFGPPLPAEGGYGVCHLCYHGASAEDIAACAVHLDCGDLEEKLEGEAQQFTGLGGETTVAFALNSGRG